MANHRQSTQQQQGPGQGSSQGQGFRGNQSQAMQSQMSPYPTPNARVGSEGYSQGDYAERFSERDYDSRGQSFGSGRGMNEFDNAYGSGSFRWNSESDSQRRPQSQDSNTERNYRSGYQGGSYREAGTYQGQRDSYQRDNYQGQQDWHRGQQQDGYQSSRNNSRDTDFGSYDTRSQRSSEFQPWNDRSSRNTNSDSFSLGSQRGGGYSASRLDGGPNFMEREQMQNYEGTHSGKGPKGWKRSDESIKERVCECLEHDSHIDASEIEIAVADGVVTLTGSVEDRRMKRMAEEAIEHLPGVRDVRNELRANSTAFGTQTESKSEKAQKSGISSKH